MFTGIIQTQGSVVRRDPRRLLIAAEGFSQKPGASVAVNGVCLTVVEVRNGGLSLELSEETLRRTALSELHPGDQVNLEPSLPLGGELGGHLVLGHVDTVGKITLFELKEGGATLEVAFDPTFSELLADKGSVAVDGISLTPFSVRPKRMTHSSLGSLRCAIVPYTLAHTNLRFRRPGDRVNLEFDILAKYVRTWREK